MLAFQAGVEGLWLRFRQINALLLDRLARPVQHRTTDGDIDHRVRPLDHLQTLQWEAAKYTLFHDRQTQNIQYHGTGVVLVCGIQSGNVAQGDAVQLQNQYSHPFSQTLPHAWMLKTQSEQ